MIASVSGRVAAVTGEIAVVEVGGVGLAVQCTPNTLATLRPGVDARLATSLVVREDSLTLFGFASDDERAVLGLEGLEPDDARAAGGVALRHVAADLHLGELAREPEDPGLEQ